MFLCPKCGTKSHVHKTEQLSDAVRRRYHCRSANCEFRFTTKETVVFRDRQYVAPPTEPVPEETADQEETAA